MNAFYGVLGTSACRFSIPRLASSITMRGHAIMRQTKALIESQGYDVIYGDTDSTFVWLKRRTAKTRRANRPLAGRFRQRLVGAELAKRAYQRPGAGI
jgi:DNA polymerase elongation subunit (family B)